MFRELYISYNVLYLYIYIYVYILSFIFIVYDIAPMNIHLYSSAQLIVNIDVIVLDMFKIMVMFIGGSRQCVC